MSQLFQFANSYVMPFWFSMILAPKWGWTRKVMESGWPLVPLAVVYILGVAPQLLSTLPLLSNPELEPIRALLGTPAGTTLAWIHFLCFDLFVGRWIYLDSRAQGFSALWVSPVLVLTLMFGPAGWLAYFGVSRQLRRRPAS